MLQKFLLGIFCLGAFLVNQASCQGSCERITVDYFGSTTELNSTEGALRLILLPGGESSQDVEVRIDEIQIVCESQALEQNRYRFVSVVVSFFCFSTDNRVTECQDATVLNTQQFDFGCSIGSNVWVRSLLGSDDFTQRENPVATLSTQLDSQCFVCLSQDNANRLGSSVTVDDTTHCLDCIATCDQGLQRCYATTGATTTQLCCNFFYRGNCVSDCPGSLVAESPAYECQCPVLSDANGVFSFTDGRNPDSMASLMCNTGYELTGGIATATCADSGWSSTPSCSRINCGDVDGVENGEVSYTDTTFFNSEATYECDDGYYRTGVTSRVCTASSTWDPALTMTTDCDLCSEAISNCVLCEPGDSDDSPICNQCEEDYNLINNMCIEVGVTGAGTGCDTACIIGIILAIIAVVVITIVVIVVAFVLYKYLSDPATKLAKTDTGGLNGVARDNPLYVDPATVTEDGLDGVENGATETTPLEA